MGAVVCDVKASHDEREVGGGRGYACGAVG